MIVILGGSGYVGKAFQAALHRRSVPFQSLSRKEMDYSNPPKLIGFLKEIKPDFLINAAGYTGRPNVDACEVAKADCLAGNALLPSIVREACDVVGIPWGHVSSGCIFTGAKPDGSGFTESDAPNFSFRQDNCSFYLAAKHWVKNCWKG